MSPVVPTMSPSPVFSPSRIQRLAHSLGYPDSFLSLLLEQHQPFLFFLTLMFLKKQGQLSCIVSHMWI